MKKVLQQKISKRLLNLINFHKHKRIRASLCSNKKKVSFFSGISVKYIKGPGTGIYQKKRKNYGEKQYFLRKDRLKYYKISSLSKKHEVVEIKNEILSKVLTEEKGKSNIKRHPKQHVSSNVPFDNSNLNINLEETSKICMEKYKIDSYMYHILCKFPRRYTQNFLGKEILRTYYTMPYKASTINGVLNKILRSYYKNLSKKALINLANSRRKENIKNPQKNNNSFKEFSHSTENAKNFLKNIENRLDSTLLRLFQNKPLYTTKHYWGKKRLQFQHPKYKLKLPLVNYNSKQINQLILHKKIYLNGKKIKSRNIKIKNMDKLSYAGIPVVNLYEKNGWSKNVLEEKTGTVKVPNNNKKELELAIGDTISNFLEKKTHKETLFIRKFKDKEFLKNINLCSSTSKEDEEKSKIKKSNDSLINYIKNLKVKRFTEIFYLTYKNIHLFDRSMTLLNKEQNIETVDGQETQTNVIYNLESHIEPIYNNIGFNQSIFILWPLTKLLQGKNWKGHEKKKVLTELQGLRQQQKLKSREQEKGQKNLTQYQLHQQLNIQSTQKKLKNLLTWKKVQSNLIASAQDSVDSAQNSNNEFLLPKERHSLLKQANILLQKPTILDAESSKNYASIVYGTKLCKWVKYQQENKKTYYNKIYNKTHFFDWELKNFQMLLQYYKKF